MYGQLQQGKVSETPGEKQPELAELGQQFGSLLERNAILIKELANKVNTLSTMPNDPEAAKREKGYDNSWCGQIREGLERFSAQNSYLQSILNHLDRVI